MEERATVLKSMPVSAQFQFWKHCLRVGSARMTG